jgi:DnaJ-class molecular chaperone
MLKVHILSICSHCNGEAYVPMGEAKSSKGETYTRYAPCPMCEGSGNEPKWVSLVDFTKLFHQATCPHEHTTYQGSMRFCAGDVWDDIQEVCVDCGAKLDGHTLAEFIQDDH